MATSPPYSFLVDQSILFVLVVGLVEKIDESLLHV